jgi:hypothetical protein
MRTGKWIGSCCDLSTPADVLVAIARAAPENRAEEDQGRADATDQALKKKPSGS